MPKNIILCSDGTGFSRLLLFFRGYRSLIKVKLVYRAAIAYQVP